MKYYKYLSLITLFALASFVVLSCSKDDDNSTPANTSYDSYYVKYEVTTGEQVSYAKKTTYSITFKDLNVEKHVKVESKWEGTYGPFKKGDNVYLKVSASGKYNAIARLSVSKNQEPFTIKSEERNTQNCNLQYIIDF